MGNPLRERRTAADWAAVSQVIEIADQIGDFEQLSGIIEADLSVLDADNVPAEWRAAAVTGRLEFGFADAQRTLPMVDCRLAATIDLVCQRCLEAFGLPLEVEVKLLLLDFDQEIGGYEEYDVWEMEEPMLRPLDIVEELLIMALPFAAMHVDSATCRALTPEEGESVEEMTTPFAALRKQMAQDNEGSA